MPVTILDTGYFNGVPDSDQADANAAQATAAAVQPTVQINSNVSPNAGLAAATGTAYAATTSGTTTRIRHVGACLGYQQTLSGVSDSTPSQFLSIVSPAGYAAGHYFLAGTIPAGLSSAGEDIPAQAGVRRIWIDFKPTHYGYSNGVYGSGGTPAAGAVTDAGHLGTFIASCQAGGLDLRISLWHECYTYFVKGLGLTQAQSNLDYTNSVGYYGAVLRSYGMPVVFDVANYSASAQWGHWAATIGSSGSPGLGYAACSLGYIDEVYTDFYVDELGSAGGGTGGVSPQGRLDEVAVLASQFSLPLGLLELGACPATTSPAFSQADTDAFLSYVITWLSNWNSNSTVSTYAGTISTTSVADILMWATIDGPGATTPNCPSQWGAQTITNYKTLFSAYDGGTY